MKVTLCFVVIYVKYGHVTCIASDHEMETKKQIGTVIVSYAILGRQTSFFPVLQRCHKRELQEQGTEHAFEAHTICRRCLLLVLSA